MKTNFPNIKTSRLLLREIFDSDHESIFKGLSHPKVIEYYGISYESMEACKEQMLWFKDDKQLWWAICSPDNKTFYGAGGLNDINHVEKSAEIGLWLLPEYWGKGILKEALPLIANYGLEELHLKRIEGFVETENSKCKKAMSKLDFKLEKTLQECEMKNGKFISLDVYVKTI